ncbi:MAG: type II toxin-antitoxin system RelE/ParE family toxin [Deltaproteobacteria bacterium]|nr:type II toxin-antitoxin system RelE/ParE family toxin [Deltaproteobacteria bacterium]
MPKIEVKFFKDERNRCPILDWFKELPKNVEAKARTRIEELERQGHELRRPFADYLRDGIYELRWRHQSVNFRILYFFYRRDVVILSHGLTKEDRVPLREIEMAIKNKVIYENNPEKYSCTEEKSEN